MARIFIACERSGIVREAFRALGHNAWSCDIEEAEDGSRHHLRGDATYYMHAWKWDLMVAHPPCTYLASSGLHWNHRVPGRATKTELALQFVDALLRAPIKHIAIENPRGCIGTRLTNTLGVLGYQRSSFQPYQFGHDASKETVLWLKNLPPLEPTSHVAPRIVAGRFRWANQTDSGQNRLGPSPTRWMERSRTYAGVAEAMALQWSRFLAACAA